MHHIQNLVTTVPPDSEPITLAQAKSHLNVEISDDDALISALIIAARQIVEKETRRSLVVRSYELRLNRFPFAYPIGYTNSYSLETPASSLFGIISLPKPPLVSVTSVTYVDTLGNVQTWPTDQYQVDDGGVAQGTLCPAYGKFFPQTRIQLNAVRIVYQAGYTEVPAVATQAMLLLIGSWYKNREAVTEGSQVELPMGVKALLSVLNFGSYV